MHMPCVCHTVCHALCQVTADRKRKLQDVQSGLTLLGLCPLLVHIWEKNGAPLIAAQSGLCNCAAVQGAHAPRAHPPLTPPFPYTRRIHARTA